VQSFDNIMYPAIHLAGWYDCFLHSTLENHQQMQGEQHPLQRLIIGPWTHGDFGSFQGERDFGITASEQFLEGKETLTDLHIRWFDHWLKEKNTNVANEAPVKLFVMGINRWRDEAEWPLARTIYRPYYFHSDGEANSRWGDGKLSPHLPEAETKQNTFIHDANNPVPTVGGQTLYRGIQTYGPRDQQAVEERDDVLVYTTSGLVDAIEVTGPIKVTLWVASEAKEVTFTAKLVDVFPDGRSIQLADGISREIMTTSANGNKIEIDLWATSNVF